MQLSFSSLFFILCMAFGLYVVLGDSPTEKIERGCSPVKWVGNFTTGVATAASAKAEQGAEESKATLHQSCKFIAFRTFYRDEYLRLKEIIKQREGQSIKDEK